MINNDTELRTALAKLVAAHAKNDEAAWLTERNRAGLSDGRDLPDHARYAWKAVEAYLEQATGKS